MAKPCLRCLEEFNAGGHQYVKGMEISLKETADWPEGSLPRRLANGFVEHAVTGELYVEEVSTDEVVRMRRPTTIKV